MKRLNGKLLVSVTLSASLVMELAMGTSLFSFHAWAGQKRSGGESSHSLSASAKRTRPQSVSQFLNEGTSLTLDQLPSLLQTKIIDFLDMSSRDQIAQISQSYKKSVGKFGYYPELLQIKSDSYESFITQYNQTRTQDANSFDVKTPLALEFTHPHISKSDILKILAHPEFKSVERVSLGAVTTLSPIEKTQIENRFVFREGQALNAKITRIVSSPHDSLIAAANEVGNIMIWNVQTGKLVQTTSILDNDEDNNDQLTLADAMRQKLTSIDTLTFNPDGSQLIAATLQDSQFNVWSGPQFEKSTLYYLPLRTTGIEETPFTIRPLADPHQYLVFDTFGITPIQTPLTSIMKSVHSELNGESVAFPASTQVPFQKVVVSPSGRRILGIHNSQFNYFFGHRTPQDTPFSFQSYMSRIYTHKAEFVCSLTTPVNQTAFSPDDSLLFTASSNQKAYIWDASSCQALFTLPYENIPHVTAASFSQDNTLLATLHSNGNVITWDLIHKKPLMVLKGTHHKASSVSFMQNSNHLITGMTDGSAAIWNPETKTLLKRFSPRPTGFQISGISPDGSKSIIVNELGVAKIINNETGEDLITLHSQPGAIIPMKRPVHMKLALFSQDSNQVLYTSSPSHLVLYDFRTHAQKEIAQGEDYVSAAAFSPDGSHLIVAYDIDPEDEAESEFAFKIYDIRPTEPREARSLALFDIHHDFINQVAFSSDGTEIYSVSDEGEMVIWETQTGLPLNKILLGNNENTARMDNFPSGSLKFSPSRKSLLIQLDTEIMIWDLEKNTWKQLLDYGTQRVISTSISDDEKTIIALTDSGIISVRDAQTGRTVEEIQPPRGKFQTFAYSHETRKLITTTDQAETFVWNLNSLFRIR